MNITNPTLQGTRPLTIDFNLYADGDEVYKKKLIAMLIVNLLELQRAQLLAEHQNNQTIFLDACHKMTFTLNILNDKDLTEAVNHLKDPLLILLEKKQQAIYLLNRVCDEIIRSLENESRKVLPV